jgi:alginate O-acetyltransferase complex protein AlgI
MLFNSFTFLVFFLTVTTLYFIIPHKSRWFLLLLASCYFYMFFIPIYILILALTIVIDYFAGIIIEKSSGKKRKLFLVLSLISNIGVLAFFKYFNFLCENINGLLALINIQHSIPFMSILLPIGLSFHTFQAMSYTIEVYRGNQIAERKFGIYALYVMFYPQLVAGPIERPQNLLHQFYERHYFDIQRVVEGLKLMLWGLFKKVVIADRLSLYVDQVYNNSTKYRGFELLVATFFFAVQIYCDFSGYSDIAIGAAKVMGFKLMTNFRKPYFAKSINEFWKRWHISLSSWFRDFLYISLGGNRVVKWRWYYNLFITFLISGIWHGANWTFVIWGAMNGLYLIFETMTQKPLSSLSSLLCIDRIKSLNALIKVFWTFILIDFSWIFFRARNLSEALYIIKHLPVGLRETSYIFYDKLPYFALILIFFTLEYFQRNREYSPFLLKTNNQWYRVLNTIIYSLFIWSIIVYGNSGSKEFIYFQF